MQQDGQNLRIVMLDKRRHAAQCPIYGTCAKGRMIESEIGFDGWREGPWTTEGNEETFWNDGSLYFGYIYFVVCILIILMIIGLYVFVKMFLSVKLKIENFTLFKVNFNKCDH